MQAGVDIKPIEVTGVNVAKRLKSIGVTHVPTLYLRDKRNTKMLVGPEILQFLQQNEESEEEVPFQHRSRQTYAPPRRESPVKEASESVGSSEIESVAGSEVGSEVGSEIESEIEVSDGEGVENEKGKLNPKAVMRMMQAQNSAAQGLD